MSALSTRWKLAVVGCIVYSAITWYFGGVVPGERKAVAQGKPEAKADSLPLMYYGVAACSNPGCHGGNPPKNWIADKGLICRCIEALDWDKRDKHAEAYNVLTWQRGKQMSKILGYDVTKSEACLTCHGVVIKDPKLLASSKENLFKIEEGVNCVACHGAHEEWVARHGVLVSAQNGDRSPVMRKKNRAACGISGTPSSELNFAFLAMSAI